MKSLLVCDYAPVRVKDGTAGVLFAGDGLVVNQGQVLAFFERGVECGDGDNSAGGLDARGWPGVEGEADSILVLDFLEVHGDLGVCSRWGVDDGKEGVKRNYGVNKD